MPPVADNVVVAPRHIAAEPGVAVIVGNAFTVTVTVAVELHPRDVPVTVYVAVDVPLNIGLAIAALLRFVAGFQL